MYILQSENLTLTGENIKDRIDFLHQVNPDGDLIIGTCGMAQLTFNVYDLNKILRDTDITSKTFIYSKSKSTTHTSRWKDFKTIHPQLMVIHNTLKYCSFDTLPYFRVYNNDILQSTAQPTEPVTCIYVKDDKVYLGHENADYMSVYSLMGDKLDNFILTTFTQTKIKSGRALNYQGNIVTEYHVKQYDLVPVDFIEQTTIYEQVGIFTANKPTRENDSNITVVAYDNMFKFDKVIDSWASSVGYPITAYNLLVSLCNYCGVNLSTTSITNGDYRIIKKFQLDNTTGRAVLQWICELSANIGFFDSLGKLHVEFYKPVTTKFLPEHYSMTRQKEYVTTKIDKVQVKVQDNDVGVIVPPNEPKTNAYIIENNPLMYTANDGELRPYVTNIFNKIKEFAYIPFEFDTVLDNNFTANVGEIVKVQTKSGSTISTIIMVKHIVGEIETFSSSGNIVRISQSNSLNQAIKMLNGRTNQLVNTVDEFSVTLTEVKSETETNTTQLRLQQGEILLKVDANGIISAINMSREGIKIQGDKIDIDGFVTFSDLTDGVTTISGDNITTGTIIAEVINASVSRLKYLTVGGEDPFRVFPNGIRYADGSFAITEGDGEGGSMMQIGTTGKKLTIGAGYQVVENDIDNPTFMVIGAPSIVITKEFIQFNKPTSDVWTGTQAEYDALSNKNTIKLAVIKS